MFWRIAPPTNSTVSLEAATDLLTDLFFETRFPSLLDQYTINETPFTIAIGGVTFGGSGKTQVVLALAKRILARSRLGQSCHLAILTHGYQSRFAKQKTRQIDLTDPEISLGTREQLLQYFGDEALMLVHALNHEFSSSMVTFIIGGSWFEKWKFARSHGAGVILSDGGLYTADLPRDIGITVLSAHDRLCLFPKGSLTRPISKWAHNQSAQEAYLLWGIEDQVKSLQKDISFNIRSKIQINQFINLAYGVKSHSPIEQVKGRISAICGIAQAQRFKLTLQAMGYEVVRWITVRDHQAFSKSILEQVINTPTEQWVTTLKDVPKFNTIPSNLWALELDLNLV